MRNVMNIESVKNCSSKLEMYLREENDDIMAISNCIKRLNNNCNATETREFNDSLTDLQKSMDRVRSNHEIDNLIIKENVKSYIVTSKKVESQMNDMEYVR
jgi:phosphotransferase system IIB component